MYHPEVYSLVEAVVKHTTCVFTGSCCGPVAVSQTINTIGLLPRGIIAGGSSGEVMCFNPGRELLCPDRGMVTARQIWDFSLKELLPLSADCPLCGHRFAPSGEIIAVVKAKQRQSAFEPGNNASTSKSLVSEPDPDLLADCPNCGEGLVFNPFFATHFEDEPKATHEETRDSLSDVAEHSIRKGYWEAAIAALERLLKLEPDSVIIQSQLAYSKIKALKDNSLPKIAEIDTLIGMIADSGHTGQADELRGLLKKKLNELKPQRKKPWWKRT